MSTDWYDDDNGDDDDSDEGWRAHSTTNLIEAVKEQNMPEIKRLISTYAAPALEMIQVDSNQRDCFYHAICIGNIDLFNFLLSFVKEINARVSILIASIKLSIQSRQESFVKCLIGHLRLFRFPDGIHLELVVGAIDRRYLPVVRCFEEWNNTRGIKFKEFLFSAVKIGDVELVNYFLEKHGDLELVDSFGRTALHYACYYGNFTVARNLVEKGANILHRSNNGWTVTSLCARNDSIPLAFIKYLVKKGADLNDNSVLLSAIAAPTDKIIGLLDMGFSFGPNRDINFYMLCVAFSRRDLRLARAVIKESINCQYTTRVMMAMGPHICRPWPRMTAVIACVSFFVDAEDLLSALLAKGSPPAELYNGQSALDIAVANHRTEYVRLLVAAGQSSIQSQTIQLHCFVQRHGHAPRELLLILSTLKKFPEVDVLFSADETEIMQKRIEKLRISFNFDRIFEILTSFGEANLMEDITMPILRYSVPYLHLVRDFFIWQISYKIRHFHES